MKSNILALDIAFCGVTIPNGMSILPPGIDSQLVRKKLYYGHFMCYVFHRDYIVKKAWMCMR